MTQNWPTTREELLAAVDRFTRENGGVAPNHIWVPDGMYAEMCCFDKQESIPARHLREKKICGMHAIHRGPPHEFKLEYLPPVDIKNDRLLVLSGATVVILGARGLCVPATTQAAWVTTVPANDGPDPEANWPREDHFRVRISARAGTVDELTESFREMLTRCFDRMTNNGDISPYLGEASLRWQNQALAGVPSGNLAESGREVLESREARRSEMRGFKPRQTGL
jgi:hypothetical protein